MKVQVQVPVATRQTLLRGSQWWILVAPTYPLGEIKVYPDDRAGSHATFPHQNYNGPPKDGLPWRSGETCVTTPRRGLGRQVADPEPAEPESRLAWHVARLVAWVDDAVTDQLRRTGDPFEVPYFPTSTKHRLAFSETPERLADWSSRIGRYGTANLARPLPVKEVHVVRSFVDASGDDLPTPPWGSMITDHDPEADETALWILLREPPVLPPFQAPVTWADLRDALQKQGIQLDQILRSLSSSVRDEASHVLMLGMPIPVNVGETANRVHWQGIKLPVLQPQHQPVRGGFRAKTAWKVERHRFFSDKERVDWMKSENWADDQLLTRGKLSDALTRCRIGMLGWGALGSMIAESLVRGGVRDILGVDDEVITMGNSTRHALTGASVERGKVPELVRRLSMISPHARPKGIMKKFGDLSNTDEAQLALCNVIIDSTAGTDVPAMIEQASWAPEKLVITTHVSANADRTYVYSTRSFRAAAYAGSIDPHVAEDTRRADPNGFAMEGVGCYSPVFPATYADMQIAANMVVKTIDDIVAGKLATGLYVIERGSDLSYRREKVDSV